MKTILFGSILFFVIQSKENCGDYYKYTTSNDILNYTIFSSTEYNIKDTLKFNNKR
jgi:hypothetical protein